MRFKSEVDLEDEPPIPDLLSRKLWKITKGAKQLAVRESTGAKSWKQTNVLYLTVKDNRSRPDEAHEDIVEAVARMMHARWLDRTEEQESPDAVLFRIEAEKAQKASTRARPYFTIKWDPDSSTDGDGPDYDDYREEVLLELLERLRADGDRKDAYIDELHSTLLEQSRMHTEPIAAAGRMGKLANDMMRDALGMLQGVLMTQYSQEAARAEQEGKTERQKEMFNRLDKYFAFASKAAGDQFGAFIKRKMGGGNAATEAEERKAKRAARQTQRSQPEQEPVEVDEDEDDEDEALENPIAVLCEVFGSSLTPVQRKTMREKISPEIYALFDELFCAQTDDEAIELFLEIKRRADMMELLELAAMLDASQVEYYERVSEEVDKRTEGSEGDDDSDDGSDDGDDDDSVDSDV